RLPAPFRFATPPRFARGGTTPPRRHVPPRRARDFFACPFASRIDSREPERCFSIIRPLALHHNDSPAPLRGILGRPNVSLPMASLPMTDLIEVSLSRILIRENNDQQFICLHEKAG